MQERLVQRKSYRDSDRKADPLDQARANKPGMSMPVPFAAALSAYLKHTKKQAKSKRATVETAWRYAVESVDGLQGIVDKTHVRSVTKTGALVVLVNGSSLAHQLGVVYRNRLLKCIREMLDGRYTIASLVVKPFGSRGKNG